LVVIVIIGVGFLLVSQSLQAGQQAQQDAVQVLDRTTVEVDDLRLTVNATGSVAPMRQVPLLFEASGVVQEILVEIGDIVKAGDKLARLDAADFQTSLNDALVGLEIQRIAYDMLTSPATEVDLAVAEAALNAALAGLNAAYSSANPNQAEIARLQSEISRNRLWQAQIQRDNAAAALGIPSDVAQTMSVPSLQQAEYGAEIADANADAAENRGPDPGGIASANAAVVSAQTQLDRLENGASDFDLQTAEINLSAALLAVDQAQAALDRMTLVAPFDGVIAQNNLVVGEILPSGQSAMLLIDDGELYVDLAIDETDVVKIEVGQPAELTLDALPGAAITGRVTRVAVTPMVLGQLVTYPVRVTLDPTDEPVRIGMSATATIIVDELKDVLIVANRFVRIDRTTRQAYVTVQNENGRYTEILVELGLRNELESQIISGVEAGQEIVLLPSTNFDLFGEEEE
jgi:HlyD family secretion protein